MEIQVIEEMPDEEQSQNPYGNSISPNAFGSEQFGATNSLLQSAKSSKSAAKFFKN